MEVFSSFGTLSDCEVFVDIHDDGVLGVDEPMAFLVFYSPAPDYLLCASHGPLCASHTSEGQSDQATLVRSTTATRLTTMH